VFAATLRSVKDACELQMRGHTDCHVVLTKAPLTPAEVASSLGSAPWQWITLAGLFGKPRGTRRRRMTVRLRMPAKPLFEELLPGDWALPPDVDFVLIPQQFGEGPPDDDRGRDEPDEPPPDPTPQSVGTPT
jgi:hypothetical protein